MNGWPAHFLSGTPQELHHGSMALLSIGNGHAPLARRAIVHQPLEPSLVLGSTQPDSVADREACARAGVSLARRRSGGGAVLVQPEAVAWVDLLVPAGDPLWCDDIGRAAWWVGAAWASALSELAGVKAEVWQGPLVHNAWSRLVCFAGLGPGEVTISGRKVVGISQRRNRAGALFQCACLLEWCPSDIVDLLALGRQDADELHRALSGAAYALSGPAPSDVVNALLACLP